MCLNYLSSRLRDRFISAQLISVTLRRPDQAWMMIELNGEAIGFQVLDDFDQADAIANLWYCLGALSWRGFGIMPLSIKKLTDSPPLSLRVISAWVGSINTASIRCLEKAEFREVGRIKNAFNVNGLHDRVIFEKQINVNDK